MSAELLITMGIYHVPRKNVFFPGKYNVNDAKINGIAIGTRKSHGNQQFRRRNGPHVL